MCEPASRDARVRAYAGHGCAPRSRRPVIEVRGQLRMRASKSVVARVGVQTTPQVRLFLGEGTLQIGHMLHVDEKALCSSVQQCRLRLLPCQRVELTVK